MEGRSARFFKAPSAHLLKSLSKYRESTHHMVGAFIMSKVGGRMKIKDHLSKGTRRKLNNLSKPNEKRKNKYNEKLSPYDLKDLMGTNRQTLKRGKGGAYKGK